MTVMARRARAPVTRAGVLAAVCAAFACAAPPPARPAPSRVSSPASVVLSATAAPAEPPLRLKILGFNDFHGQLSPKRELGRPIGGAAVLAAYLRGAMAGREDHTFVVHAGDFVGASPPNSGLLKDEPSVDVLNSLAAASSCGGAQPGACRVIGGLGNHEFDEGKDELVRLLRGGNYRTGPFLDDPWR